MKVEFAGDDLERICTNEAHRMGLPFAVIKVARRKLLQMEAARDEQDLRNLKGLMFKEPLGDRDGRRSIWINSQCRIVFTLSDGGTSSVITIIEIGDAH